MLEELALLLVVLNVFHTYLSLPSQSLTKTICYPNLYNLNANAIKHGYKHEDAAILAYETTLKKGYTNFQVTKCGLLINRGNTHCCGLGCGEVKCPLCIQDANLQDNAALRNSCLVTEDRSGWSFQDVDFKCLYFKNGRVKFFLSMEF